MTNFKNIVAAITLTVAIASSATFANAGLIVSDLTNNTPSCTQTSDTKGERFNTGVLLGDIVLAGLTGIVVAFTDEGPVNCGIVVARS